MILKDGTTYEIPAEAIRLYQQAYPNIDVHQELAKMAAWAFSNPSRRKTRRGVSRFINSWLARARPSQAPSTRDTSLFEDLTDTSWAN